MDPNPSKKKRIVLCRGQYCNMSRRADAILKKLEPLIDELNGDQYPKPIKLEIANCLSMCGAGPNIMIYPQGIACNGLTEADIPTLVEKYLRSSGDS